MTTEEYQQSYWPMLRDTVDQMLDLPPGSYTPLHPFHQLYSAVYRCCAQERGPQLHEALVGHLNKRLVHWSCRLAGIEDDEAFLAQFVKDLKQFFLVLPGIVSIFKFMDSTANHPSLRSRQPALREVGLKIFSKRVSDLHAARAVRLLAASNQQEPFTDIVVTESKTGNADHMVVDIKTISSADHRSLMLLRDHSQQQRERDGIDAICSLLFHLEPDYRRMDPAFFSAHLPDAPALLTEAEEKTRIMNSIYNESSKARLGSLFGEDAMDPEMGWVRE
jgi:hypothetical protein